MRRANVVFPEPAGPSIEIARLNGYFRGPVLSRWKISSREILAIFLASAI